MRYCYDSVSSGVFLLKLRCQGTSHHFVNIHGVNYKKSTEDASDALTLAYTLEGVRSEKLPRSLAVSCFWMGVGRESNLENSSKFRIYTIENPTFDTPHFGRGQNRKVNICPSPLPYP